MKDERTGGEDKPIRWGIIGCGNVVETKNGVPTYTADHSELAGVWNRTAEKAQAWVDAQGHGKVYETMEELLADPSIDIVYVATTPNCHKEQAIAVAQANKHCYLEKPIAGDPEDAIAHEGVMGGVREEAPLERTEIFTDVDTYPGFGQIQDIVNELRGVPGAICTSTLDNAMKTLKITLAARNAR